jgi:hypothetical protein
VTRTAATLEARINPAGSFTSYYFEWGTDDSYGTRVPAAFNLSAGSDTEPVVVSIPLDGLQAASVYHFRVVASNARGATVGADQAFSTLNDDGLAWGRYYELVSPLGKGSAGMAGESGGLGGGEQQFQAAPDGNALHYVIGFGLDDTTFGSGDQLYRSDRGRDGWQLTEQISPSIEGQGEASQGGQGASGGFYNSWVAQDLDCAFSTSSLRLTDDPEAQVAIEAGGHNLYRRNADLSYDLVTNLAPTNPEDAQALPEQAYSLVGASQDCSRVVFQTKFRYPGVPITAAGGRQLYEWRDGTLANPVAIPTGPDTTEVPTEAVPGAGTDIGIQNALNEDGSRFYFTTSGAGTSAPLGRQALFLSEDGKDPVEVSASQTGTVNNADVRYQTATPDGAHAFFIGRYGLAPNDSSAGATNCTLGSGNELGIGCDLYRYSVGEPGVLIDVSASDNPADTQGASVAGVLDISADGSRVYFAAKGQLTEGEGQTFAQNTTAASRGYNVYFWEEGEPLAYVTTVAQADAAGASGVTSGILVAGANTDGSNPWRSITTPDGSHLLFQSTANLTGYDSSGNAEAYRYAAVTGELDCVSCRRDGQPPVSAGSTLPLPSRAFHGNSTTRPRSLSADGSAVFFTNRDALAPGALEGEPNVYEWRERQISLLAATPAPGMEVPASFRGASEDGATVFFVTREAIVPWDTDGGVGDIYAARVGGGFPPPLADPEPCDPLTGGACEGGGTEAPDGAGVATLAFDGQGNVADRASRVPARCNRLGRRARAVANRTRRLNRAARRSARAGNRRRAVALNRRARRLQPRARRLSNRAKRCRRAARAANTNRRASR